MRKLSIVVAAMFAATTFASTIDLSTVTNDTEFTDGDVVTGTLVIGADSQFPKLTIAAGATVTLRNAVVNPRGLSGNLYAWPAIACEGDATIVLEGENTVNGLYGDYPAIYVPYVNRLTIKGTGALTVSANGSSAAIGSGKGTSDNLDTSSVKYAGSISIQGGMITAKGGSNGGAGIGTGAGGVVGIISISGGTVVATGGNQAAGIGTGLNGRCTGNFGIGMGITRVTATCGYDVADTTAPIGAGHGGTLAFAVEVPTSLSDTTSGRTRTIEAPVLDLSNFVISTGDYSKYVGSGYAITGTLNQVAQIQIAPNATVTLRDAVIDCASSSSLCDSAGITCLGSATIILEGESFVTGFQKNPGIYVPDGCTLTICGRGSLTAASSGTGAGIGGAADINSMNGVSCGNITIAGGSIVATGGSYSAGIGSGNGACGTITIDGGTVVATGGQNAAGIGSGYKGSCSMVMIQDSINSVKATAGEGSGAEPIGAGYNGRCGSVSVDDVLGDETKGSTRTILKWRTSKLSDAAEGVVYGDGSRITGTFDGNHAITIAAGATVTLSDALIHPDRSLSGPGDFDGLTCEGDATIILEGSNVVNSIVGGHPAIYIPEGKTLTIKGTGTLRANSEALAAAIGGGQGRNGGNIVIESGRITVRGGTYGAGIGSGSDSSCGNITINGGTVVSEGIWYAAGIGAGRYGECGNITINGGAVTATGGNKASGIGSGLSSTASQAFSSCGRITIRTGVARITATCGDGCENPIGAGSDGSTCGTITVARSLDDDRGSPTRVIKSKTIDLAYLDGDYTAQDGDVIQTGDTAYNVTIPAGATVTINGVTVTGAAGGTVLPAPAFAADGDAATTKFVQGGNGTWTLTTFAEMSNDALGADVADGQIQVYAAPTVEGLDAASPMTSGVTVKKKKSAVKTVIEVTPPGNPSTQFFKVKFGE